jgi:hypothetical protein
MWDDGRHCHLGIPFVPRGRGLLLLLRRLQGTASTRTRKNTWHRAPKVGPRATRVGRYPSSHPGVRSSMKRLAMVLAAPLFLGGGCGGSTVQIDYVDFVQLGGITYVASGGPAPGAHQLPESDLGAVYGQVKTKLSGSQDPNHQLKGGDSAFVSPGTQVYRVNGYRPTFRLAARHDGRLFLYEADTNPAARFGADLLDLEGKVGYIGINSPTDGTTQLATVKDPPGTRPDRRRPCRAGQRRPIGATWRPGALLHRLSDDRRHRGDPRLLARVRSTRPRDPRSRCFTVDRRIGRLWLACPERLGEIARDSACRQGDCSPCRHTSSPPMVNRGGTSK